MNAVDRYGYVNAKLRARIGAIRSSSLEQEMLKAPGLIEAVSALRKTGYLPVAEVYDKTGDLEAMGAMLQQAEIAAYQEVARMVDPRLSRFVLSQLDKIEEENLKNTIRLWYSSVVRSQSIRWRSSYLSKNKISSDVNWTMMINSTDWQGVVEATKGTPWEPTLASFTQDQIGKDGLFDLEVALDRVCYGEMLGACDTLSEKDRDLALSIYLHDFDLKNLLKLIRFGRYYHMEASRLEKTLLPWGTLYGSKEAKAYIAMNPDSRDPMAMVERYFPQVKNDIQSAVSSFQDARHVESLLAAETLRLETYLSSERSKEYRSLLAKDPFTVGVILAYFYYYRRENTHIRAILNGKYYGYTEEKIREVVG